MHYHPSVTKILTFCRNTVYLYILWGKLFNNYGDMVKYITLIAWLISITAYCQNNVNYDESMVPDYTLPELLKSEAGTPITSVEEWQKHRRPEIMELFSTQVYGRTPSDKIDVRHEVLSEDISALGGKATARQVKFIFSNGSKEIEAILLLLLPNKPKGKSPVFVAYNFKGNHSTTHDITVLYPPTFHLVKGADHPDWERGNQINRWPYEMIIDRGYAVATMCYHDIYPDHKDLADHSILSLFPGYESNRRSPDQWQAIGAWAWGSSRIIDYLEKEERIDANKIAIMGHSRQGKAALWAGAQDERFKIVISNNSGCGGAALSRRKYGETLNIINTSFPHWFCENFRQYNNAEETLPIDQHQLIALIAPRKVYVASAEEDRWADPKGEFLSTYHASPVYQLHGLSAIESDQLPALHAPIMEDMGYHLRAGVHDVTDYDWKRYLDFGDKHFRK